MFLLKSKKLKSEKFYSLKPNECFEYLNGLSKLNRSWMRMWVDHIDCVTIQLTNTRKQFNGCCISLNGILLEKSVQKKVSN